MKHFQLYELVDKLTYETEGDDAWKYFKPEALEMLDNIREFFDYPITINNWKSGGQFSFRGYRPKTYPAKLSPMGSAHRTGGAFDMDIKGYTADEARHKIIQNQDHPLLLNIMRMEDNVSWLHVDVLQTGKPRIYLFKV